MRIRFDGQTEGPSEPEISELDDSVLVNEQILRFEVAVEDAVRVAVENALEDLVEVRLRET